MALIDPVFANVPGQTPQDVERRLKLAKQLMEGAPKEVKHPLQGLNLLLASAMSGYQDSKAAEEEKAGIASGNKTLAEALMGSVFPSAPSAPQSDTSAPTSSAKADNPNLPSRLDFARSDAKPVDLSGNRKAFVDALMPAAIEASQRTGVDPRIIVAQAAQETGWGKSAPGNNYFGIKSHGQGGGQNLTTHEVIDGKRVKINDSFRQFASPGDSVAGYADFLLKNPRYKPMMQAQGLDAQLQALGASGYATDPNYAQSVGAIARGIPMQGNAAAAIEAMATGGQMPQAPVQVASLDPSAGMSQAVPPMPQEYAATGLGPEQWAAMNAPTGQQAPPQAQPSPVVAQQPTQAAPQQQLAQALMQGGTTAGPTAEEEILGPAINRAGASGADQNRRMIADLLANPYTAPMGQQLAAEMLQQQMKGTTRQDLINAGKGRIYDPNTGKWITAPDMGTDAPTVQSFYDKDGREYKAQWDGQKREWVPVGGAKLPSGMSLKTNPDGTVEFVQGSGAGQKLTEQQGKDVTYYTRGIDADNILGNLDTELTDWSQANTEKIPLGLGNYLRTPEFRQAKQAADSFLAAILRKDTGAAITKQEFELYGPMFLPVPADDPDTIQQKRRARQVALLAIRSGLGTAEAIGEANRIILGVEEKQLPQAPAAQRKTVIDGYTIEPIEE